MAADLVQLATSFGAPGLLVAFMVWDRTTQNRISKDRIDADLKMATAMTLLTERISHVR